MGERTEQQIVRRRRDLEPVEPSPAVRRQIRVGPADDRYEREADQTADRVLSNLAFAVPAPDNTSRIQRSAQMPSGARASGAASTPSSRIQRVSQPIGAAGGEVDDETSERLEQSRGRGSALDDSVRRSMEGAFGNADFGAVRIHDDAESADLNARLGAKAFTRGSDIYLGRGAPAPTSPDGQGLLAHELTHTLQQQGTAQRTVRRLAYNKPIKHVSSIDVFQGGASGLVAAVSDGSKPVIVKSNQANAAEVVAADKLMRGGKFKSGKYKVKAPKSRLATTSDVAEMKAKAAQGALVSPDPRNFVTGLDGPSPTLIAESMEGESMRDQMLASVAKNVTTAEDGTKTATYTRDDLKVGELTKLLTRTAPIKAMAKSMGADAAMGMTDRVIAFFNPENFLFNPKTKRFNYVDNTSSDYAGALTSKVTTDGLSNARFNFNTWANNTYVGQMASDPAALAVRIVANYTGLKADGDPADSRGGLIAPFRLQGKAARAQNDMNDVYRELSAAILANYAALLAATEAGLAAGRATIVKLLANPLPLTKNLPEAVRLEAVTSLLARRAMLNGVTDTDAAWEAGNTQARKLLKMKYAPAVPAFNAGVMKAMMAKPDPNVGGEQI